MAPLTNVTKKEQFKWTDVVEASFQQMTSSLVLALLDFSQPFVVNVMHGDLVEGNYHTKSTTDYF